MGAQLVGADKHVNWVAGLLIAAGALAIVIWIFGCFFLNQFGQLDESNQKLMSEVAKYGIIFILIGIALAVAYYSKVKSWLKRKGWIDEY